MSYRDKGVALYESPHTIETRDGLPRTARGMLELRNQCSKAFLCGAPRENNMNPRFQV